MVDMQGDRGHSEDGDNPGVKGFSLSSFDPDQLLGAQKRDKALLPLREYLASGVTPSEGELFGCNPEVKCYYLERDCFRLDDSGIIWRQTDNSKVQDRLLVPRELRGEVMRLCHDIPSSGHQGVTRSMERLRQTFYWWGMSADIKNYVRICGVCKNNKEQKGIPSKSSIIQDIPGGNPHGESSFRL